jgi:hypothetical protein
LTVAAFFGVGLLAVALGRLALSSGPAAGDGRIHDTSFAKLESHLGRRLWAPTWLPSGMEPVEGGCIQGVYRVLANYENRRTETGMILGQEPRSTERDRYHRDRILPRADTKATIGDQTGYFIVDQTGQRRLFWPTEDSWLVVSSYHMTDEDLLHIAQSVR